MLTPIALTSALRQPGFDLACVSLTIRTYVHFSTLLRVHSFHHSPTARVLDKLKIYARFGPEEYNWEMAETGLYVLYTKLLKGSAD